MTKESTLRIDKQLEKSGLLQVFDNLPDAIIITNYDDGTILYANRTALALSGYVESGKVIGKTTLELGAFADYDDRRFIIEMLEKDGHIENKEIRFRVADGEIIHGSVSAAIIQFSGVTCIFSSTRNITTQKKLEEELQKNEIRYRAVIENSGDALYVTLDQKIIDVNNRACEMLGYSRRELIGQSVFDIDEDCTEEDINEISNQLHQGRFVTYCSRHRHKNNELIPVELRIATAVLEDKCHVFVLARDITKRLQTMRDLDTSEDRLRHIVESSQAIIWEVDKNLMYTYISPAIQNILGYEPEEITGSSFYDYLFPIKRKSLKKIIPKYIKNNHRFDDFGFKIRHKDGKLRHLSASGVIIKDEQGNLTAIRGSTIDLTGFIKAEQARLISEQQFHSAFEYTPIGMALADKQGRLIQVNHAICDLLGFSNNELINRTIINLTYPDDLEESSRLYQKLFDKKIDSYQIKQRYLHKDGYPISCLSSGSIIRDDNNQPWMMIAQIEDLTEIENKERDSQLMQSKLQQTQKLESLGVLAGGIAHDFNNLLMSILGNCDLALMDLSGNASSRLYLQEIQRVARHAADLCNQMLAYSGKGNFIIETVDLSKTIKDMIEILRLGITKKAELDIVFSNDVLPVKVDLVQLRQVLMNLLTNASDALDDKPGVIRITTDAIDCSEKDLAQGQGAEHPVPGRYACLTIHDSGCGMDKETLQRLFDPFYTTKHSGQGLGLSAVLGIVKSHSGLIEVESQEKQGSCFRLFFPLVSNNELQSDYKNIPPSPESEWMGNGMVLFVDDEAYVRRVGIHMLKKLGFQVVTAKDGYEAIEMFRKHADEIICVLLDMTMPRMDGAQCFRELRKIRPEIDVIVSSGYSTMELSQRFSDEGKLQVLHKPFQLSELRDTMRKLITADSH